jgi:catechol-2,3-dioxygenase
MSSFNQTYQEGSKMPQIAGLGHVGIYADDLMKMRDFYTRVMGLSVADEDLENRGMCFLSSDPVAEHHEFVLMKGRVTRDDARVIQQISFKVPSIQDLREYKKRIDAENLKIDRIVSHGNAFGMYFFDPEGNRIELYYRTGFPVPQPHGDPLDLSKSDEELLSEARELLYSKR